MIDVTSILVGIAFIPVFYVFFLLIAIAFYTIQSGDKQEQLLLAIFVLGVIFSLVTGIVI